MNLQSRADDVDPHGVMRGAPGPRSLFFFEIIEGEALEGVDGQGEGVLLTEDGFVEREAGYYFEETGDDCGEG